MPVRLMNWIILGAIVVIVVFVVTFNVSTQNIATRTVGETEATMDTIGIGGVRTHLNDAGSLKKEVAYFNKEELLASLKEDLVNSQKGLTYDIQLDYIFIDGYGNATSDDEQIRGIEYRVQYLDDEGKVRGTAERHLVINQMK